MIANRLLSRTFLARCAILLLALAGAGATAQTDPPARAASLSHLEGSVVLAPAGDTEWTDAVLNRPVTQGDRLWTDRGGRAEVHLGSAVLHVDGETFLDFTALDGRVLQASLNEGTVNARVRRLDAGENFEIDTPQLAFRAALPGDYRIDVDPANGTTQVDVRSGSAILYGASGESQQVVAGQQLAFSGRDLERVAAQPPRDDGFDRWAADRNRHEDESVAARYVPRDVVGYQQLDPYGTWEQDPTYGPVWFPQITIADWAPYRYGHWEWIRPWGWTWVDDAPWGFAPFHYGRWATIGRRWCWVPGRIGPRPIYSPALVAFIGGTGGRANWSLSIGSSPGIAWYPLAPGEAWRPFYRASPTYVRNVNRNIDRRGSPSGSVHIHQRSGEAVTAVRVDDFSHGRPVHDHWTRVNPAEIARAPVGVMPVLPQPQRPLAASRVVPPAAVPRPAPTAPAFAGRPPSRVVPPQFQQAPPQPRAQMQPPGQPRPQIQPQPQVQQRAAPPPHERREERVRPVMPVPREDRPVMQAPQRPGERPQVRTEEQRNPRAADEQRRAQARPLQLQQLERARRDQQAADQRIQREQQLQAVRQQEEQRHAAQLQLQREHAVRQQQASQERLAQQQAQRAQREQAAHRQQELQQQRASQQQQAQRQMAAPAAPRQAPAARGGAGERRPPPAQERRDERRSPGEEEGRGRGQGYGRGG